jgi:hypothetical protein
VNSGSVSAIKANISAMAQQGRWLKPRLRYGSRSSEGWVLAKRSVVSGKTQLLDLFVAMF